MHVSIQINVVLRSFNNDVNPNDNLFLERRELLVRAVEGYNREQPAAGLLYNGDIEQVVQRVLPVAELLFNMPKLRPEKDGKDWLQYMRNNIQQATFGDLVNNPEVLLKIFVKTMKRNGNSEVHTILTMCPHDSKHVS